MFFGAGALYGFYWGFKTPFFLETNQKKNKRGDQPGPRGLLGPKGKGAQGGERKIWVAAGEKLFTKAKKPKKVVVLGFFGQFSFTDVKPKNQKRGTPFSGFF